MDVCIRKEKWNPHSTLSDSGIQKVKYENKHAGHGAWAFVSPGTRRLRQDDCGEFKATLDYIVPGHKPLTLTSKPTNLSEGKIS